MESHCDCHIHRSRPIINVITIIQNPIGNRCWLLYYYGWITHSILYIPWARYRPPDRTIHLGNSCLCVRPAIRFRISEWIYSKPGGTFYRWWCVSCAFLLSLCTQCAHVHMHVRVNRACICAFDNFWTDSLPICWEHMSHHMWHGYVLFMFTYSVRVHVRARTWLTR
jgi:hypothetical protein